MVIEEKQLQDLTDNIMGIRKSLDDRGKLDDAHAKRLSDTEISLEQIKKDLAEYRRTSLIARQQTSVLRPGEVVTQECAEWLGCYYIAELEKKGALKNLETAHHDALITRAMKGLNIQSRAALATTDIPLPVDYSGQIVELVWKYGQARQLGTVYPLPVITTKLPKLVLGEPAFALVAISGSVPEKVPQIAFVTFTAAKWGGIVRYPTEIDADSIVPLGQFLARYIAREMSKLEDTVFFTADGSGTYNSLTGVLGQEITLGNKIIAATGNTSSDKLPLANFRQLRSQVSSAALAGAAYYMNLTMENLLVSFNTSATVTPYIANGLKGSTLDGFPIKWVDVMPVYSTSATINANQVGFGDLSYHYLGVRSGIRIDLSRDVYFATDEWGLRALEQFTTGLMADKSNATLAFPAS